MPGNLPCCTGRGGEGAATLGREAPCPAASGAGGEVVFICGVGGGGRV